MRRPWRPFCPPETYVRYQKAIGLEPPKAENQPTGPLPQHFADEFGWEEMAREVARVYNELPPEQRAATAIFANSYGQAGAIDFFGKKYGLPKAISNHQNYWYWGPRDYTGESVIVLGSDGTRRPRTFRERGGGRAHLSSLFAARRAFRDFLVPRPEHDAASALAEDEEVGLRLDRALRRSMPSAASRTRIHRATERDPHGVHARLTA